MWQFRAASRLTAHTNPLYGHAAYDTALAFYYDGCYREAARVFHRLLAPKTELPGYNGDGLRAWKTTSAGTTYFVYDGETPLLELNSSGGVTAENTWGANGLLCRNTGSAVYYTFDPQSLPSVRVEGQTGG